MSKPKITIKVISLLMLLAMLLSIAIVNPITVEAASEYSVKVTQQNSYNKNGKFYMSFDIKNNDSDYPIKVWAELYNPSGEKVFAWGKSEIGKDKSKVINFGTEYGHLKSGKYTFKLIYSYGYFEQTAYYKYTIKHTRKESFAIKDYEKVVMNDTMVYKWNIQCTNLKNQALTIKIYDPNGDLVYSTEGPKRKTNNEVGWFSWSGVITGADGDKIKCPSGTYLVQLTATGSNKVVEQEFKLNLN